MMGASGSKNYRALWIRQAQRLDQFGYFAQYPAKRRTEILRKGDLGSHPPDQACRIALDLLARGHYTQTLACANRLQDEFGIVGDEVRKTLLAVLQEAVPESYRPAREVLEPSPGYPFLFQSSTLNSPIYLKFQIQGGAKRPQLRINSCHKPDYQESAQFT